MFYILKNRHNSLILRSWNFPKNASLLPIFTSHVNHVSIIQIFITTLVPMFSKNYHFSLILASKLDLLSVFWKRALISCLTWWGVNSFARGPLPSAHLSSISFKDAPNNIISSFNFLHFWTWCSINAGSC